ncbi:MAG: hypothetical protein LBC42_03960 [Puniceicoccales bacterium]|nr:hypothetical protein [Puniceicoccales bacterium]
MEFQTFVTAANDFGLPKGKLPLAATGAEVLIDFDPSTIAKIYWLLQSLEISYAYEVNELGTFSSSYVVESAVEPLQRLLNPVTFSHEQIVDGVGQVFEWATGDVRLDNAGRYSYQMQLWEASYPYQEVLLSIEPQANYDLLDSATISLFGKNLTLYLQALSTMSLSGTITAFSITHSP